MLPLNDWYSLNATQILALLGSNSISVEEYALSLLERVNVRDHIVKAWAFIDPKLILEQARALDQIPQSQRGPLHGVAIGIKDVFDTKDMPTRYGSLIYKENLPTLDSEAVAILRRAGALIFGKTTTSEFTYPNSGTDTTNPHDASRTPGGSSAGSAAAVADLQVPLSIGTQTGGSVIRPSSYTGVWAMKPTFGTIPMEGVKPCAPSLDTVGFFARDVEDLQLLYDVLAVSPNEAPRGSPLAEMKVGLVKTPQWHSAGAGTIIAMEHASKVLRAQSIDVEEVEFPEDLPNELSLSQAIGNVIMGESQRSFLEDYNSNGRLMDAENKALMQDVSESRDAERHYATSTILRSQLRVDQMMKYYTILIAPSAPDVAPKGIDDFGPATFNSLWTHMPVINVPAVTTEHGMPVGLSIVAGRSFDRHLLSVSRALGPVLIEHLGAQRSI